MKTKSCTFHTRHTTSLALPFPRHRLRFSISSGINDNQFSSGSRRPFLLRRRRRRRNRRRRCRCSRRRCRRNLSQHGGGLSSLTLAPERRVLAVFADVGEVDEFIFAVVDGEIDESRPRSQIEILETFDEFEAEGRRQRRAKADETLALVW